MKRFFWMSFSRVVPEGEPGNIGAVLMTIDNRPNLTPDDVRVIAENRGLIPDGAESIMIGEGDADMINEYPIDRFMPREELEKYSSLVSYRAPADVCDDCLEQMRHPN